MDPSLLLARPSSGGSSLDGANAAVHRVPYGTLVRAPPELAALVMGSTGSANSHEHEYDDDDFLGGGGGASSSAAQQQRQSGKSESVDDVEGEEEEDDSDDDAPAKSKRKRARTNTAASANGADGKSERDNATGRRKIRIEFIEDDSRRHITFSKRKAGIMKKAYELATLTGTQVLLLVVSQTGLVYTFTTPKLAPVVKENAGKELIRRCLESDEGGAADELSAGEARKKGGDQMPRLPTASKRKRAGDMSRQGSGSGGSANGSAPSLSGHDELGMPSLVGGHHQSSQSPHLGGAYGLPPNINYNFGPSPYDLMGAPPPQQQQQPHHPQQQQQHMAHGHDGGVAPQNAAWAFDGFDGRPSSAGNPSAHSAGLLAQQKLYGSNEAAHHAHQQQQQQQHHQQQQHAAQQQHAQQQAQQQQQHAQQQQQHPQQQGAPGGGMWQHGASMSGGAHMHHMPPHQASMAQKQPGVQSWAR